MRHKLPITWIVFNNNGIGGGPSALPENAPLPPGAFVPNARYDKVIEAFGGKGYHVETPRNFAPRCGNLSQWGHHLDQCLDQSAVQATAAAVRLAVALSPSRRGQGFHGGHIGEPSCGGGGSIHTWSAPAS